MRRKKRKIKQGHTPALKNKNQKNKMEAKKMDNPKLGISRMLNWNEPFDGEFGLGYRIHNLATEGKPSVIGLSLDEQKRPERFDIEYLRCLGIQAADVSTLEFY